MDSSLLILGCISLVIFIKILLALYSAYIFRKTINKLPGPKGNILFGSGSSARRLKKEDRLLKIQICSVRYKDGLFRTWLGNEPTVHLHKPEHVEIILRSTTNIQKAPLYKYLEPWLGKALLTASGKKWMQDRKLITPAFHFNILEQYAVVMSEKAEIFVKCLEKQLKENSEEPIDIFPYANRCTLDVICETAMGVNINMQEDTENEYGKAVHRFTELLMYRIFRPWLAWDWVFALTKVGKEYYAAINVMHTFTRNVIKKKKISRELKHFDEEVQAFDEIGKPKRKAFLDLLLDAREKNGNPMTDEELREQVDTVMFAGHDTTAAAISWTLFCLGNNPDIQEKVHQELDDIFGDSDKTATTKEIAQLKYLDRVTKEALRLYPSAPGFLRKLSEDVKIDDYIIPKGCVVALSSFGTHRHPDIWPDPEKFDPDRFLLENSKNRHPYAYIPFSAGPRNCLGQKYAQLEEKFVLAAILRKWKVKSILKEGHIKFYGALILRPSEGIYLHFIPKK
ncbi:cytochrome P450 4C1-like [Polistes fuscatus]|uniref:cytochrome P450 4C1-like n=1 Tax=Polistes fuscatus TaxID=30207 RepID=UPI001CA8F84D|nr:cytochrome P450 4C1-like [Polistes fuscatus]XP_043488237.1 cytochrome P450 4C1-like [Polistes fuscatus]XP_043488238.1 cytochrome P450 4C1-like [Polistes fuscatus]